MTDREALKELLRRFGLTPYGAGPERIPGLDTPIPSEIILAANVGEVEGGNGLHARFCFDDEGRFEMLAINE